MRLLVSKSTRQEKIKAFNRAQVEHLLAATSNSERRFYPMFFLRARTGLRLGEALAFHWDDVDVQGRELRVESSIPNYPFQQGSSLSAGNINYMTLRAADALKRLREIETFA